MDRIAELETALQSAYEAQNSTLVFALCADIASEINQQSYREGQARLEASRNYEAQRKGA